LADQVQAVREVQ